MDVNIILHGDALTRLRDLPDNSIDCCVTSPPYYMLREYNVAGQLGQESTPEKFISNLVDVFREVKRVLKPQGTCWVNIGDSYSAKQKNRAKDKFKGNDISMPYAPKKTGAGIKYKDLMGMPWALAFALRDDGWWLRQDIIWNKPNPMPESCNDRCTKSHEYIFLLSKSSRYYYDQKAIATPYADKTYTTFGNENKAGYGDGTGLIASENWAQRAPVRKPKQWKTPDGWDTGPGAHGTIHRNGREKGKPYKEHKNLQRDDKNHSFHEASKAAKLGDIHSAYGDGHSGNKDANGDLIGDGLANKRSVWTVATKSFKEAHFATFPEELIVDCIKAGCPIDGIVLDPFFGAGTTGLVACKLQRNYIGIELNEKYINEIAQPRLDRELGLFR